MKFAAAYKTNGFWRKVSWSDETKTELFDHNDETYGWRSKDEACTSKNIVSTVKHGVVAVWME